MTGISLQWFALVLIVGAGFIWSPWAGLIALGAVLFIVGTQLERVDDHEQEKN